jgi:hypothetical protein
MIESRVDIIDDRSGRVIGSCHGPTLAGTCSQRGPHAVVACAGRRISLLAGGPGNWMLWVPAGSRECPLATARDDS